MWYICTMECYSVVRKDEITKFVVYGPKKKLSNVTQNQRDKCHMFSLIYGSKFKIFRCECITWLTLDTREYEETTEEEAVLGDKQRWWMMYLKRKTE